MSRAKKISWLSIRPHEPQKERRKVDGEAQELRKKKIHEEETKKSEITGPASCFLFDQPVSHPKFLKPGFFIYKMEKIK